MPIKLHQNSGRYLAVRSFQPHCLKEAIFIMRYSMWVQAFILLLVYAKTNALVVYSCDSPHANFSSISLYEAAPCPDPVTSYSKPEKKRIQVVQAGEFLEVKGWACQATHTIVHRICGWDSIGYGNGGDNFYPEPLPVTGSECANAVQTGRINVHGHTMHVSKNQVSRDHWWTQGEETSDGTCYPESFSFRGQYYPSATQLTYVFFKIVEVTGKLNLASGQVVFPSGVRGVYKTGWLEDAAEGTLVWQAKDGQCKDKLSEIYRGMSTVRRRADVSPGNGLDGAIVQVADHETDQFAGFLIKERVPLCGRLCYQTQIAGALVCFYEDKKPLFPYLHYKKEIYRETTALEGKLGALFMDTNIRMYQHFEEFHSDVCKVERMVISNTLLDLAGGNDLALLHRLGYGYKVNVVGATAYVTRCQELQAKVEQHQGNCTAEMPVILSDGTKTYANPLTRIIQKYPTIIPCTPIMPARFKLSGSWWCSYPQIMECSPPSLLNTTTGQFEGQVFTQNMRGGLYSQEQIDSHKRWAEINSARSPLLQMITDRATGNVHVGMPHQFGSILGDEEREEITWSVISTVSPLVSIFGRMYLHFSGFVLFCFMLRVVADGLWHFFDIYKKHGLSWKLLGACWSTAHGIIMSPRAMFDASHGELKKVKGAVNRMYEAKFAGKEVEEKVDIEGLPLTEPEEEEAPNSKKKRFRKNKRNWRKIYPKLRRDQYHSSTDDEFRAESKKRGGGSDPYA